MKGNFSFKIDENFPLPINVQLQEQIKWLIAMSVIMPGDFLPPTNFLAEQLQLNRNTINRVYTQLRDEGLVSLQKGRGTQVTDSEETRQLIANRQPLFPKIQGVLEKTTEQGLALRDLLIPTFAYLQLFQTDVDLSTAEFCLVVSREDDYYFYESEIIRYAGGKVHTIFIEDLRNDVNLNIEEIFRTMKCLITTWQYMRELELLPTTVNKQMLAIGFIAELSMLIDISKLNLGSKVAFISPVGSGAQWMADQARGAGISHIEIIPIGMDSLNELLYTIEKVDKIYTSSVIYKQIHKLAPDKTYVFGMQLEQSSQTLLSELGRRTKEGSI
ncbi:hypothetical protein BEP19_04020 [Ammoniphilus oxalaticus]|uniref:HTH gntR-type domain-containing protein n=1 Tax=Ammoniphilus oxalaticus TaxID=66863 RepID=A0A419SLQ8_9BACL|nr:GntR family transcriptional regulator [Ammoniphilus oxalaticus]RKD25007.1 hypothetical protein BEP19_04020 [Ammoniphilus oxalaticus]